MGINKGYKEIKYGKKAVRRNYSKMRFDIELPDLIEIQTKSFAEFMDTGISQLLKDISPIVGHNGELKLYFEDHFLEEPKFGIQESKDRGLSYAKTIKARVKLESVREGQVRESEILLTEMPVMTPSGTFIINGAERVVVSQIIRSAGAYYSEEYDKRTNTLKYTAQIIPTRGAWIEYESNNRDVLFVKVDRSRRVPLTTFLRAIGLGRNKDINDLFGNSKYIRETLAADASR